MTPDSEDPSIIPPPVGTPKEQLERAVRDLWSMVLESGDDFVVLMDRRRMSALVARTPDGLYGISWECEDGTWVTFERELENPREAAFRAYQGPHRA